MEKPYKLQSLEEKRVVVLGGLGFTGANIVQKAAQLNAKIAVFDACLDPYGWNFENISEIRDQVMFTKADIRDINALEKTFSEFKPDIIFNCAGQVSHVDSMTDPWLDIDINCKGNLNVVEACRRKADNANLVYAGTRAQMGKSSYTPMDEKHPLNPTDIYGVNKQAGEAYAMVYHNAYGMKCSSVRMNNCFGPRHQMKHGKYGILNWFIRRAIKEEKISIYGNGKQLRDYNYIEDAVDALILCGTNKKAEGEVFLLGSGKSLSFASMVKKIVEATGSGSYEFTPWPKDREVIEVGDVSVSFEKIKEKLGWKPSTGFDEGLKKTVEWYKHEGRLEKYV
ncbi:MAG: NAD-dependent epimerase/dehydratase family protein [Candidatus Micrarchaeia archaeon]